MNLEMPGTLDDKEEKPAEGIMFQSARQLPLMDPSMSTERPQGLLLWQKHHVMLFLQLFLLLIILLSYLLFLLFAPSLINTYLVTWQDLVGTHLISKN